MKTRAFVLFLLFAPLLLFLLNFSALPSAAVAQPNLSVTPQTGTSLLFIENVGQFDEQARFQVRGGNGTMWLADDALWLTLVSPTEQPTNQSDSRFVGPDTPTPYIQTGVNIKLSFLGANTAPELMPFNPLDISLNFFTGSDHKVWRTDVPVWSGVRYRELYPGVDLEITHTTGQIQARLACHTNCRDTLQQVRLQVEGVESLQLVAGQLVLGTLAGDFVLPFLGTDITSDNTATTLTLNPRLENNILSFSVSSAHTTYLTSPTTSENLMGLLYGTFLGGENVDHMEDVTVDEAGHAYITGWTYSAGFPTTPGTFDPDLAGNTDAVVVKLHPDGSELLYATFLGGLENERSLSVAGDASGNTYVAGRTNSLDFPATAGAFDSTYNGGEDAFLVKLNASGNALVYATYIGGLGDDYGNALVIDGLGNAYVSGKTDSADFPATSGVFDTTYNGLDDVFVIKINETGNTLIYATYLGDTGYEGSYAIAVDRSGNVFVAGDTYSFNFPTTPGAFDTTFNGFLETFVAKLNQNGTDLLYATFLGGYDFEQITDIAVDETGHVYVTGLTFSFNFPTTPGAFDATYNGNVDVFVVKFNPSGSDLVYATFLGGEIGDRSYSMVLDEAGNVYITGSTNSIDFPVSPDAYDPTYNGDYDLFIASLDATGSDLTHATFLGTSVDEYGFGIAKDGSGNMYLVGYTESSSFPTTPGAFDTTFNGGNSDGFAIKFALTYSPVQAGFSGLPTSGIVPLNVTFTNLSMGDFNTCLWQFGDGATSSNCNSPEHIYGTTGSYTVTLTVSGTGGTDTFIQPAYITVYEPLEANFAATPTSGHSPLLVYFTNLSGGNFTSCLWDFGEGTTSTLCYDPTHLYDTLGTYTVTLTISGPGGTATKTKTDYILVIPHPLFLPMLTRPQ